MEYVRIIREVKFDIGMSERESEAVFQVLQKPPKDYEARNGQAKGVRDNGP